MNGLFSYNQIWMAPVNGEKNFRTPKGIYCYKIMSFGLKNTGAIYQRAIQNIFYDMFYQHIEWYVDYLMVKSKEKKSFARSLSRARIRQWRRF